MNNVQLLGNLTRDPEVKYLPSGAALCEFSIAQNKKWKDKASGQVKEKVRFIDCKAWGRTAEVIGEHLSKGKKILIEGELEYDSWEDRESGKKRSKLYVTVGQFHFLPGGAGRDTNADARQSMSGEDNQDGGGTYLDPDTGETVPF